MFRKTVENTLRAELNAVIANISNIKVVKYITWNTTWVLSAIRNTNTREAELNKEITNVSNIGEIKSIMWNTTWVLLAVRNVITN